MQVHRKPKRYLIFAFCTRLCQYVINIDSGAGYKTILEDFGVGLSTSRLIKVGDSYSKNSKVLTY